MGACQRVSLPHPQQMIERKEGVTQGEVYEVVSDILTVQTRDRSQKLLLTRGLGQQADKFRSVCWEDGMTGLIPSLSPTPLEENVFDCVDVCVSLSPFMILPP
ncbi:hypothetical protein RRG08_031154 [Elysia crispata]|uniref:Uncharacterized protein n=1 Tax=Elysia crispata TaxID=231223 RepID=A0AAE0ZG89_9GAST|nr:hypothetical protein RRG08_031154 [Elysia crispata]